jgi:hypothetical protein
MSKWGEQSWESDLFHPKGIFATLRVYPSHAITQGGISYFASTSEEWERLHRITCALKDTGLLIQKNIPNFSKRPPPHLLCVAAFCREPLSYRSLVALLQSFTQGVLSTMAKLPGSEAF